jgi:hypothetical protein
VGFARWIALVVAGCGFHPTAMTTSTDGASDGNGSAMIDGPTLGSGSGSAVCYDTEGVKLHVCLVQAPSGAKHPPSGTIDTGSASTQCEPLAATSDRACVLSGITVSIDPGVTISASGSRPLVLIATAEIDVNGTIDVASYTKGAQAGKLGPAADANGCQQGTLPNHSGGGAGGTFTSKGANGGDDNNDNGSHGVAAPTIGAVMRGGCAGQTGANTGGRGGAGGGAFALIAQTLAISSTGTIDASGAGGAGGSSGANRGGGGGGTGGLIVLTAQSVTIDGKVFADGGGGGAGSTGPSAGGSGDDPLDPFTVPSGGLAGDPNAGDGGDGFLDPGPPSVGQASTQGADGGGGGGGGAGYIHVTTGVTINGGGTFSPQPQ